MLRITMVKTLTEELVSTCKGNIINKLEDDNSKVNRVKI